MRRSMVWLLVLVEFLFGGLSSDGVSSSRYSVDIGDLASCKLDLLGGVK